MERTNEPLNFTVLFIRFICWIIAIIVLGIFLLTVIAILLEQRIANAASATINSTLKTKITYDKPSFSLIRGFPNATLTLKNIHVPADTPQASVLVEAQEIKLKCSIWSMVFGDYDFHSISFHEGSAYLHKNELGISNFHILNTENKNLETEIFNIKNITFSNFQINYQDDFSNNKIEYLAKDLTIQNLSTHFQSREKYIEKELEEVYIYISGNSIIKSLFLKGSSVLFENEFAPYISCIYSPKDDMFSIDEYAYFNLNGSKFNLAGDWGIIFDENFKDEIAGVYTDFQITAKEVKFNTLVGLLPIQDKSRLNNWTSNHRGQITYTLKGNFMKELSPIINLNIQLFSATIQHSKTISPFSKLNLDLHYTNQATNNSLPSLTINNFHTLIGRHKIAFNYKRTGADNPYIIFEGMATIPFNSVAPLLGDSLENTGGLITIDSFYFEGAAKDFLSDKEDKIKAYLSLNLKEIQAYYKNKAIFFEKGSMVLEKQTLSLKDISLQMDNTNLNIQGKVGNTLATLFHKEENGHKYPFIFNLAMLGKEVDIDNIQNYLIPILKTNINADLLSEKAQGKLIFQVAQLNKDAINISNVNLNMLFNNKQIHITEASGDWAKGKVNIIGLLTIDKQIRYKLLSRLESINFGQWLQENNNFEQAAISNENLIGMASATLYSEGIWRDSSVDKGKNMRLLCDIKIENGHLNNYKPLAAIGQKLQIEDFKKINFIDAYIQASFQNNSLNYHQVLLRSDGYNMLMQGKINSDSHFQGKFKFNTASVLLKNIQMHNTIPTPIKTYIPEMYNLYMQAQGDISNNTMQVNYNNMSQIELALYTEKERSLEAYFAEFHKYIQQTINTSKTTLTNTEFPLQKITEPSTWSNLSEVN